MRQILIAIAMTLAACAAPTPDLEVGTTESDIISCGATSSSGFCCLRGSTFCCEWDAAGMNCDSTLQPGQTDEIPDESIPPPTEVCEAISLADPGTSSCQSDLIGCAVRGDEGICCHVTAGICCSWSGSSHGCVTW